MKTPNRKSGLSQKMLALAVLAAFGQAYAGEEEIEMLARPESYVSVGAGAASGDSRDRAIYGQYNGRRLDGSSLLLDIDVNRRDEAMGLWTNFRGSNLGMDSQEFSFSQNMQGDWKYAVEYSELVRRDPRTINSGLVNPLTTTPTVVSLATPGSGPDLNLDIRRKAASLSAEKWITPNLLFEANVKSEKRKGSRLSGIGVICVPPAMSAVSSIPCDPASGALLMLPEPINSTTRQFEARLNYSGEKFMLSGGYYGSFFSNENGSLNPAVSGNLYNPDGTVIDTSTTPGSTLAGYLQQPFALPPDNQAHQFYLSGNYAFTPGTRATFKYAYTHATQSEDFAATGLAGAPAGVANLNGALDNRLAQLGLTARPLAKLSLLANLRYEDKADNTQLAAYNGAYTNGLNSSTKYNGKLEGSYQLPDNYRATLGVDYASMHRALPVASATIPANSLTALREDTREYGQRAELRRSMSETLNAAVSYTHSQRDGERWSKPAAGFPQVSDSSIYSTNGIFPMTLMDRKRDKLGVVLDWTPLDMLSLQFMFEDGKDSYTAPTTQGLHDTGMTSCGIDAALNISEKWRVTGYAYQGRQTLHQDHLGYMAELKNININTGLGVIGRFSGKLEVGGDVSLMDDTNQYQTGSAGGLPDVTYRVSSLKLFGKYAVQKNGDIRIDLLLQSVQFDEWSWGYNGTQFTYSDNSSVTLQQKQDVTFLGAGYIYRFR